MAAPATIPYIARMSGDSQTLATANGTGLAFRKMHGLGNDFVVIDARGRADPVSPALARALGDRHRGIGFDQLAVIRDADGVAARIDFWNADGSLANACGNATRCVARLLFDEGQRGALALQTGRGRLEARDLGDGRISVNMGPPETDWRAIPLARAVDLDALPIDGSPSAVGMGNPHCVFIVPDAEAADVAGIGARIEPHPLFPEGTNVEFVQVLDRETIRMRVWERGAGITLACGSGACAAAVATARRGLTERRMTVVLDGGPLEIDWREDGVWMTGPTAAVFEGHLSPQFLAALA
jgi:diaminopimelate epimerase